MLTEIGYIIFMDYEKYISRGTYERKSKMV